MLVLSFDKYAKVIKVENITGLSKDTDTLHHLCKFSINLGYSRISL